MRIWEALARGRLLRINTGSAGGHGHRGILMALLFMAILLLASSERVLADSPPNISTEIGWQAPGAQHVTDVEAAFNNARREEEKQLGLAVGTLGDLDLPSQAVWDATSDDVKALTIINAERVARAGMKPGVIGLPLTGVQPDLNVIAQEYANYLVTNNLTGHDADGRTPSQRIDQDPALGPCHEDLRWVENIYYSWGENFPSLVERAIYSWLYRDSANNWEYRQAVLLQDKPLDNPDPELGFNNNAGSMADEGFVGIGVARIEDFELPPVLGKRTENVVIMDLIDPISTGACPWDGGPTVTSIEPDSGTNDGWLQITNLAGSGFKNGAAVKLTSAGQPDIVASSVQWVSASKLTCSLNLTGAAAGTWNVVVTNPDARSATLSNGFRVMEAGPGKEYVAFLPVTQRTQAPEANARFGALIDTVVFQGVPDGFYGTADSMWTGYDSFWGFRTSRSLVFFNPSTIPQAATIQWAGLHLYVNHISVIGQGNQTISAYQIGGEWDPNLVTWNTQPSQAGKYGQIIVNTNQKQWYIMDVTDLVQGWVTGSLDNWGIMLRGPESSGGQPVVIGFGTRDYEKGQYAAVLEVTYRNSSSSLGRTAGRVGFGPEAEAVPVGGAGPGLLPSDVR